MPGSVELVWDCGCLLGEGPVFDDRTGVLWFVDIEAPAVLRYDTSTGAQATFAMPEKTGCIALRERGGFVAGLQSGFAFVDLDGTSPGITPIHDPEPDLPGNRFNDGKVDSRGRLWAGTMDDAIVAPTGTLYRLDPDLTCHPMDAGYVVTNGPAFSPDGTTVYHNDSVEGLIHAFDCNPDTGTLSGKRVFAEIEAGVPDGLTVDQDGCVWLAHWDGWRVTRFTPGGAVDTVLELPAARVTSCTFGGEDLRTLFITTARTGLGAGELARQPAAGGLFATRVETPGTTTHRFAG